MEPTSIIALITAGIPFLTAIFKKIFKTENLTAKSGVNALIPIVLGICSSGLYAKSQGSDWLTSIAIGLGSGGAAASARNIDRNLTGIAQEINNLLCGKKNI